MILSLPRASFPQQLSVWLPVRLSVCLSVHPSVCLSICQAIHPPIRLSVCLFWLSVPLSVCPPISLPVCLSTPLSVHPSVRVSPPLLSLHLTRGTGRVLGWKQILEERFLHGIVVCPQLSWQRGSEDGALREQHIVSKVIL